MPPQPRRALRYGALLASLLLLALIVPLFENTNYGSLAMDIVGTAILAAGVWAASRSRRDVLILIALAVVMTARWLPIPEQRVMVLMSSVTSVIFFWYLVALILADLAAATEVSLDTIGGALCGYALIGIAWGALFFVIALLDRAAFDLPPGKFTYARLQSDFLLLMHYSLATLTTAGYGTMHARSVLALNLTAIEAMVGQFYIAVLVARLVSLQILQHQAR
jgi:voltage-gated potassium channel